MQKVNVVEGILETAVELANTVVEFGEKYSIDFFEKRIKGKKSLVVCGLVDNKTVGAIVAYDKYLDGSFYCWMAGVNPKYRRLGVLSSMMDYLENWAKKNGYKSIKIKTRNNKREMLGYLVKNGYDFLEVVEKENIGNSRILLEKLF